MIESDDVKFNQLSNCYSGSHSMFCFHNFATSKEDEMRGKTFDHIADIYFPDKDIDFLSIDIDEADYLILDGLKRRPNVVCIETGLH